jgi:hypothetical protein
VKGAALDVPVWLPQPNVDLNICMFERLYQDTIVVNSRWVHTWKRYQQRQR